MIQITIQTEKKTKRLMKLMKYEKLDRLVRMDFDIVFDFRY